MKTQVTDWDTYLQLRLNDPDPFCRLMAKRLLFEDKLRKAGLYDEYLQLFWQS